MTDQSTNAGGILWANNPLEGASELRQRVPAAMAGGFADALQRVKSGLPARGAGHPAAPRFNAMGYAPGQRTSFSPQQFASLLGRVRPPVQPPRRQPPRPPQSPSPAGRTPIPQCLPPATGPNSVIGDERKYLGPRPLNVYPGGIGPFGSVDNNGPSTDNAVARFDGATGTLIQNSTTLIDDAGNVTIAGNLRAASINYPVADGTNGHVVKTNGAGQLSIGQVGTAGIADRNVSYAKLPEVAASTLLGRGAGAGNGDAQEISLGTGLSMSGQTLNASASGGDVVGPALATDNAITRFDGTSGKLIQSSGALLHDTGKIECVSLEAGGLQYPISDGSSGQVLRTNGAGVLTVGQAATAGISDDAVTNAKLANMAASTFKGRDSGGGTGDPQDLSATQATALLNVFSSSLKGLAPASGGGTANFLRADGNWATPLDINGLTAETAPATGDFLALYDVSASANRKMTFLNFLKVIDVLTQETSVNRTVDVLPLIDDSEVGGTPNKATPEDLGCNLTDFLTSDASSTSTTFASTGLSVTLKAGTYIIEAALYCNYATATGLKLDLNGGSASVTSVEYVIEQCSGADGQIAVRAGTSIATSNTMGTVHTDMNTLCKFTIGVSISSGGTFVIRFARTGGSGTAKVKKMSWIKVVNAPAA